MTSVQFPPGPPNSRHTLLKMSRDPIGFFLEIMRTYGDFAYVQVGARETYVVSDPALIQKIYVENVETYEKDEHTKNTFASAGQGLFVLTGAQHRIHRRTLQPLFTATEVNDYADTVIAHTQAMLGKWKPGETQDLERMLEGLTMGIVCEAIFGIQSDGLRAEFAGAMAVFQRHTGEARYHTHFSDEDTAAYQAAIGAFDRVTRQVIAESRPKERDFLSLMLAAKDPETGLSLSTEEIRDEALTLLIAGYETTTSALLWTWYLLAKHPQFEDRVLAEINEVAGDRPVTAANLSKLTLLSAVFKETLRLYPPAWIMGRQVTQPIELGGYLLQPGTQLAISPYVVHRNPKYFPDPETFNPERFVSSAKYSYAYLPFGLGSHICIGQHFASMEALLILANVLKQFRIQLPPEEVAPEGLFTLKPKTRLMATLTERDKVHKPN